MTPITCLWDGEAFQPLGRFHNLVNRDYVVGELYPMAPHYERTSKSHAHEFAWLHEAWLNLPEEQAARFPTSEALRKYALIKSGWCTVQEYPCGSRAEAVRWAANLSREGDDYLIAVPTESVVTVYRAKSQSHRAMNRADFQASKTAVLETVAAMIGVDPATLQRAEAA